VLDLNFSLWASSTPFHARNHINVNFDVRNLVILLENSAKRDNLTKIIKYENDVNKKFFCSLITKNIKNPMLLLPKFKTTLFRNHFKKNFKFIKPHFRDHNNVICI
jgi:hypothetical protein